MRQLSRLRTEMAMGAHHLAARLFPDRLMLGVEFGIIARRCLPDWIKGDTLVRPDAPQRSITVRQIAASLGRAPETVRRHVNDLRDRGALVVTEAGVMLASTAANEPTVATYLRGTHDLFLRLIEDLAHTSDYMLPVRDAPAFGFADIAERAIDTLLLPVDTFRLPGSGLMFLLWGALTAVAVRTVTYDPVLARRYADAIPPDTLRIGISLRRLAEALHIPYATAWRQMQALHESGLVTRLGGEQWTVLTANLMRDAALAVHTPPSTFTLRKVRELALLGLDPAHAGDHYSAGRPPLPDLGLADPA